MGETLVAVDYTYMPVSESAAPETSPVFGWTGMWKAISTACGEAGALDHDCAFRLYADWKSDGKVYAYDEWASGECKDAFESWTRNDRCTDDDIAATIDRLHRFEVAHGLQDGPNLNLFKLFKAITIDSAIACFSIGSDRSGWTRVAGCTDLALTALAAYKGIKTLQAARAATETVDTLADTSRALRGLHAREAVVDVPAYAGGKTSGALVRPDGSVVDLVSGIDGPALGLPKPRPGMNGNIVGHVEAHAAAVMRNEGLTSAELWINRMPCGGSNGCMVNVSRMVPEGSTLTIHVMESGTAGAYDDMIIVTGTG